MSNREKDIQPIDENGRRHGYTEHYFDNGKLFYMGTYIHGKYVGLWDVRWSNNDNTTWCDDKIYHII